MASTGKKPRKKPVDLRPQREPKPKPRPSGLDHRAGGFTASFAHEDLPWWLEVYADELTPGERVVFYAIVSGQTAVEAAHDCGLALSTVRSHVKSIHRKLQVRSMAELMAMVVWDLADQLPEQVAGHGQSPAPARRRLIYMRHVAGQVGWGCRVCHVIRMYATKAAALNSRHRHVRESEHLANGRRTRGQG